jgi:Flp pilus assembly protein TadG
VECAVLTPLLTLLLLGAIDVGQYANVHQKVSDASRAGARLAARHDAATTSEVQAVVMSYLAESSPGVPSPTLAAATVVEVTDSSGGVIPGGNIKSVSAGAGIKVRVALQYDSVRWLGIVTHLDGSTVEAATMMRRE